LRTAVSMRQLLPEPVEQIDPVTAYDADIRMPPRPGRPWVLLNMIASADGATAVEGRAGGLGGPADTRVLSLLRNVADVVLVGAGTIRAEGYAPHRPSNTTRARREARGQRPTAAFAVPTASLDLDPSASLFTEAEPQSRTIVFCPAAVDPQRRARLEAVADVVTAGETTVDLGRVFDELWGRGARVVLCEGGPTLNGQLLVEDRIDELCLTISPRLVGGPALRVVSSPLAPAGPVPLRLDRVLEADDGFLFLRYVRAVDSRQ
jgi:riboflavin biosynthesis pyrimidine reductase